MMKFMMVFMGVMFYKVPSGLGIYFITSSLWAVGERLLLPKLTHADLTPRLAADEEGEADGSDKGGGNGDGRGPRGGKGPPAATASSPSGRDGSPSSSRGSSRRRRRTPPTAS